MLKLQLPQRLEELPAYPFAVLGKRLQQMQAEGKHIIRVDMGNPDLPPPPHVVEALQHAVARPDAHGYSGYRGIVEFRRAVADYYQRRFAVEIDPEREVLPLIGSKEGLVNLILALVGPGDAVLSPRLGYPAYRMGTFLAGGEVVDVPLPAEKGFLPDLEAVSARDAARAKMMWVNYPNNPTGAFATLNDYQSMLDFCRAHNMLLCSDNPYAEVVFDGQQPAPSVLQLPDAKSYAVEFISLSKTYNMAGWRLGAAVGHPDAIAALLTVKSNMDSGHFRAIYEAGATALCDTPQSWLDERNAHYQRRRDKIVETLPQISLELEQPAKGTLYVWARVKGGDDVAYTERCLDMAGVSIAPGSFFGEDGRGYVRISLGIADKQLDEALERLRRMWLDA